MNENLESSSLKDEHDTYLEKKDEYDAYWANLRVGFDKKKDEEQKAVSRQCLKNSEMR